MYKCLQPLREEGQPDKAEPCQAALTLMADATAASHTDPDLDAEVSQLCFNGGQVGLQGFLQNYSCRLPLISEESSPLTTSCRPGL